MPGTITAHPSEPFSLSGSHVRNVLASVEARDAEPALLRIPVARTVPGGGAGVNARSNLLKCLPASSVTRLTSDTFAPPASHASYINSNTTRIGPCASARVFLKFGEV